MKINGNSIRPGNVIEHKKKLWVAVKTQHTQPGKGGAYLQVELKKLMDGTKLNERFRSSESVERVRLEEKGYQFLFKEGDLYTVMDTESYEQMTLSEEMVGAAGDFIQDGCTITVCSHEGDIVSVSPPEKVTMEVAEADAVVKGQTAAASYKPAVLENGVKVMVPPHIEVGTKIVVDTQTRDYIERARESFEMNESSITALWEKASQGSFPETAVDQELLPFIDALDKGQIRAAEKKGDQWQVNSWVKQGILLCLRYLPFQQHQETAPAWDKIPLKTKGWSDGDFAEAGYRSVPGALARRGAYIAPNVVQMPSFVNIGAYVDTGTMVDTWATIGACAQIGRNCHISGGVGIGGVLEPPQASPVIIEDNCFIGARSEIVEGMRVEEGAVIGMGVFLTPSTPIVNRQTGEVIYGRIPRGAVILPGTLPGKPLPNGQEGPHMPCAILVKQVDESTRRKTVINQLLRQGFMDYAAFEQKVS